MREILPCLRCGASAYIEHMPLESWPWVEPYYSRVRCSEGHAWDEWNDTEEEAIAAWNERYEG